MVPSSIDRLPASKSGKAFVCKTREDSGQMRLARDNNDTDPWGCPADKD